MMNIFAFFKHVDRFFFNQLDLLQGTFLFQKLTEKISSASETTQKIVFQTISIFFIFIPILLATYIYIGNFKLKHQLEIKEEIKSSIYQFVSNYNLFATLGRSELSNLSVSSEEDMRHEISQIAVRSKIKSENIQLVDFALDPNTINIKKILVTANFNALTTEALTTFINNLAREKRFKVTHVAVSRDNDKNLISGTITLLNLARDNKE